MADVALTSLVGSNIGVTLPENLTDTSSLLITTSASGNFTGAMAERIRVTGKLIISSVFLSDMTASDTKYKLIVDGVVVAQMITGNVASTSAYVYATQILSATGTVIPPILANEYVAVEIQTSVDTSMSVQIKYVEIK